MILYYLELVGITLLTGAFLSVIVFIFSAIAFKIVSYFQKDE